MDFDKDFTRTVSSIVSVSLYRHTSLCMALWPELCRRLLFAVATNCGAREQIWKIMCLSKCNSASNCVGYKICEDISNGPPGHVCNRG